MPGAGLAPWPASAPTTKSTPSAMPRWRRCACAIAVSSMVATPSARPRRRSRASSAAQVAHGLGRIAIEIREVAQHDLEHVDPAGDLRASPHQAAAIASLVSHSSGLSSANSSRATIVALPREQRRRHAAHRRPAGPRAHRRRRDRPGPRWPGSRSACRPCRTGCPAAQRVQVTGPHTFVRPAAQVAIARRDRLWSEWRRPRASSSSRGRHLGRG